MAEYTERNDNAAFLEDEFAGDDDSGISKTKQSWCTNQPSSRAGRSFDSEPSSLPFCDTHFRERTTYMKIALLFSAADKSPRALAVRLKDDKRVTHEQV